MGVDVLGQIGFVVLVGLAAKNAILIVEFAKQAEERGSDRFDAAIEAARTRLRPILMTSLAFILGVVPLMIASGAGAEMRQSLGTAVFSGMLGVTLFGLILTPVFYVADPPLCAQSRRQSRASSAAAGTGAGGVAGPTAGSRSTSLPWTLPPIHLRRRPPAAPEALLAVPAASGGQPRICRSTGTTEETPPSTA